MTAGELPASVGVVSTLRAFQVPVLTSDTRNLLTIRPYPLSDAGTT